MDLKWLQTFSRSGIREFQEAAEHLYLTQPVSQHIGNWKMN